MLGFLIAMTVVVGFWALHRMARMKPQDVRKFQRQLLGAGLSVVALFFIFRGELWLGLPALAIGAGLLGFSHLLPQGFQAGPRQAQASRSRLVAVFIQKPGRRDLSRGARFDGARRP